MHPMVGRCSLWWRSKWRRQCRRWRSFQISVRSRSSWRQVCTHRPMIEFRRGDPYPGELGPDAGVGEDPVEQGGELRVPVTDQVLDGRACLVQVHREVPSGLGYPGRGRMRGGAEDTDPAGGVFDDGEDVLTLPGQVIVSMKSTARSACAWLRRRSAEEVVDRWGAGSTPSTLRISQTVEVATLIPRVGSSPWMRRYPQDRFSRARRRTRVRTERTVGGRPRRFGFEMFACRALITLRCQRSTVSGRTSSRSRRKTVRGRAAGPRPGTPAPPA